MSATAASACVTISQTVPHISLSTSCYNVFPVCAQRSHTTGYEASIGNVFQWLFSGPRTFLPARFCILFSFGASIYFFSSLERLQHWPHTRPYVRRGPWLARVVLVGVPLIFAGDQEIYDQAASVSIRKNAGHWEKNWVKAWSLG